MNKRFGSGWLALLPALLLTPLLAHASCDTVKADIDASIKAKGVTDYTLDVVPAGQAPSAGKVVGHCQGDQQIVYARGSSGMGDADTDAKKPTMPVQGGSETPSEPSPPSSSGN